MLKDEGRRDLTDGVKCPMPLSGEAPLLEQATLARPFTRLDSFIDNTLTISTPKAELRQALERLHYALHDLPLIVRTREDSIAILELEDV